MAQDRSEEAWKVTKRLHANKSDPGDTYAHAEYTQMRMQINFERQHNAVTSFGQAKLAFSQKSFLKRLGLGFLVQFGNQCTGALIINNYITQLFFRPRDHWLASTPTAWNLRPGHCPGKFVQRLVYRQIRTPKICADRLHWYNRMLERRGRDVSGPWYPTI